MVKTLKGESPTLPKEEDRGTNLVAATENINQNPEEEDQDVNRLKKWNKKTWTLEKNPDQDDGEIGSEERSSHKTPVVDDVQPNEEKGDKDGGSDTQNLSNCGDTRVCNSMTFSLFVK